MITADIRVVDLITPEIKRIKNELDDYPDDALAEFQRLTPRRSGNARRKTRLAGAKNSQMIIADYPYAERLDEGYSDQAPNGMTQPFETWAQRRINRILKG